MTGRRLLLIAYVRDDLRTIGSLYIYANAKKMGIDVCMLYLNVESDLNTDALTDYINIINPNVIGIGLTTMDYYYSVTLTDWLKSRFPNMFIFWGGVHPTCLPEESLEHVDCISIGEGEYSVPAIVENYDNWEKLRSIEGVGLRLEDGTIRLNRAGFIDDIEGLPFPYYEFGGNQYILDGQTPYVRQLAQTDYEHYSRHGGDGYCLITSRSCPHNCSYCINSFYNKLYKDRGRNRFFRRRSVQSTIDEIRYAMNTIPTVGFINFMDDHFLINDEWLDEFEILYKEKVDRPFIIRGTPEAVTYQRMKSLKAVGLQTVQIGVQSGCAKTHKEIFHRAFHRDKILETGRILHDLGMQGMYDFIIGNEFETPDEKKLTIELMMEIPKPYIANVFHIIPFPKTDIVKWYEDHNVKPRLDPYETNYKELEADYYTMLAAMVPLTDNEIIARLLDHIDSAEGQEEIMEKYKELEAAGKVLL